MSMHLKDWFKVAGLLGLGATGFGLAGMGPLAGLLGSTAGAVAGDAFLPGALAGTAGAGGGGSLLGGTIGSGVGNGLANLFGPSSFTAATAGDAYLPGALGADGAGAAGMGSKVGGFLNSPTLGKSAKLLNMAGKAQSLLSPTPPPQMPAMRPQASAPQPLTMAYGGDAAPPSAALGAQTIDPEMLRKLLAQLQGSNYG